MPTGRKRKIVTDGVIFHQVGDRLQLGKMGGVDFKTRVDAERDILDAFDWYHSTFLAEQHATDQRTFEEKVESLVTALEAALASVKDFRAVGGTPLTRLEFSAVVNDLLREAEWEHPEFKELLADTAHYLDRLATVARALRAAFNTRLNREGPYVSSSSAIRAEFFCLLHRTLSRHGLDTSVGANSLIVELVLQIEGKASDFADPVERRRKDLARAIKLAVKPPKGG